MKYKPGKRKLFSTFFTFYKSGLIILSNIPQATQKLRKQLSH